ncbi:MAG TPA: hypothetical protein VK348_05120 [Planctomycetota bacterium]|nr:hypothetical protein [Planctomycetota bacterium]
MPTRLHLVTPLGLVLLMPSPPPQSAEPLLTVTATPGYTNYVSAELVRGHPLCILRSDGTLILSEHTFRPRAQPEFRTRLGAVPKAELDRLRAALPQLLPAKPLPNKGGAVIVDAGDIAIRVRIDGALEERHLPALSVQLDELLRYPGLAADERDAIDRRLRFAELLAGLRQFAQQPYEPARARVLVEPDTGDEAAKALPWPVAGLSLPELAHSCAGTGGAGGSGGTVAKFVEVADAKALAELAHKAPTSQVWLAGGKAFRVHWTPVVE